MTLIDKLNEKSNSVESNQKEVIKEIKEYFNNIFQSKKFEDYIEKWADINKKQMSFTVEFWKHQDGCGNTYFRVGGFKWELEKDYYHRYNTQYKEVDLVDIQNKVCEELYYLLSDKMRELGFTHLSTVNEENCFPWYDKKVTYRW